MSEMKAVGVLLGKGLPGSGHPSECMCISTLEPVSSPSVIKLLCSKEEMKLMHF